MNQKLRLNEFKELYRRLKRDNVVLDHLLLAVIYWLEQHFLDLKVETAVNKALHDFERVNTAPTGVPAPIYSSDGVDMRLTAPYFDRNLSSHISYKQR